MIRTYHDRKAAGGPGLDLPEREFGPGITKVQCPCGTWRHAFALVDVRSLPHINQDWACDGCRSHWRRHLIPVDGGGPCADQADWGRRFLAAIKTGGSR